jgi:hypothetical protein
VRRSNQVRYNRSQHTDEGRNAIVQLSRVKKLA